MHIPRFISCTLLICCAGYTFSQKTGINTIPGDSPVRVPVYRINPVQPEKYFTVPCDFGKDSLYFNDSINISQVQVTAVELVFTDYPSANDLRALNGRRLKCLLGHYPALDGNAGIGWRLIRQLDGGERERAINMFHGFVIYYRPRQNSETMKGDLLNLKIMLTPVTVSSHIKKHAFLYGTDTTHLRERYEIEPYTLVQKLPAAKALSYLGMSEQDIRYYPGEDSLFVFEIPGTDSSSEKPVMRSPEDSTVVKVLDRMPAWKNMLVVTDVTASMYPYTGQLLLWMKLHEEQRDIRQFIFFNDGDDMEDDKKIPGKTGGIYSTASSVFEVVEEAAFKAMSRGNGGAIPENNIEALLRGINDCPSCNDVVMIADNNSPVSDMILLDRLKRPVHIILCGVHGAINADYLSIARATNGSIHLINEDLDKLAELREGEIVTIDGRNYIIINGKFKLKR